MPSRRVSKNTSHRTRRKLVRSTVEALSRAPRRRASQMTKFEKDLAARMAKEISDEEDQLLMKILTETTNA